MSRATLSALYKRVRRAELRQYYYEKLKKGEKVSMNFVEYLKSLVEKTTGGTNKNKEDELSETLNDIIEKENSSLLPERETVGGNTSYDRIEYDAMTDEEVGALAEAKMSGEKQAAERAVESEIEALYKQYETEKNKSAEKYEQVRNELDTIYKNAAQAASDDALKRGLARSSIAANSVAGIESERAQRQAGAAEAYADEINRLEGEIAGLETKRQKAFNDFNIAYTAKLTAEIAALKQERDNKAAEALKYNNSLTEKEYGESLKRAEVESKLYSDALSQTKAEQEIVAAATAAQQNETYRKLYQALKTNLAAMSATDAYKEIRTNPLYKNVLNDSYYYALYDEFGR